MISYYLSFAITFYLTLTVSAITQILPPPSTEIDINSQYIFIPSEKLVEGAKYAVKADSLLNPEQKKSFTCKKVTDLADFFSLFDESENNPHLVFLDGDIDFWCKQKISFKNLQLQFAARRIILALADEQDIIIKDQGVLSWAAQQIMSELLQGRKYVLVKED